jgi:hypothetical protein
MNRLVYLVHGSSATPAVRVSLADADLKEVQDLQEWVIAHPEVLGDNVLVVTGKFNQWASGSGVARSSWSSSAAATHASMSRPLRTPPFWPGQPNQCRPTSRSR